MNAEDRITARRRLWIVLLVGVILEILVSTTLAN